MNHLSKEQSDKAMSLMCKFFTYSSSVSAMVASLNKFYQDCLNGNEIEPSRVVEGAQMERNSVCCFTSLMGIMIEYVDNIKGTPPLQNKWNTSYNLNPMFCKASRCVRLTEIASAVKELRNLLSVEANPGSYSEEVLRVMIQAIGLINTDMEIVCTTPATETTSSGFPRATATISSSIPHASATTSSGFHNDYELPFGGILGRSEDYGYGLFDGSVLDDDFDITKVLSDPEFPHTKNVQAGLPHVPLEEDQMHNVSQSEGSHVQQEDDPMLDHQAVKNAVFSRLTKMQNEIKEGKVQHDAALKALQLSGERWNAAEEAQASLLEEMNKLFR